MKYVVTVNGEKYEVEVERAGRGTSSLSRGPMARRTETPVMETKPEVETPKVVEKVVKEEKVINTPSGQGSNVVSPMPGIILDIKVAVGDKVASGDVVVVLEAMKMENEITTEASGVVSAIKVKKGDTVETDTVLVEIK